MGSIYKRGKIWYLDVRAGGKRIRQRIGTSKKVAELALKDAEVKIARDEFDFAKHDASIDKFIHKFLGYSEANPMTAIKYQIAIMRLSFPAQQ